MLKSCVLVGLDWAEHMMFLLLHVTCSCIFHAYIPFILYLIDIDLCLVHFCFFLSLSRLDCLWHQRRASLLLPGTLFVPGHHLLPLLILPPLMSSSVIIKLISTFQRTFLDGTFIRNAKSSFQISLILTYPLSSTVGVGSPFMTSWSLAPP